MKKYQIPKKHLTKLEEILKDYLKNSPKTNYLNAYRIMDYASLCFFNKIPILYVQRFLEKKYPRVRKGNIDYLVNHSYGRESVSGTFQYDGIQKQKKE